MTMVYASVLKKSYFSIPADGNAPDFFEVQSTHFRK